MVSFIDVIMFNSVDTHIYLNFHELLYQHPEGWFYFDIFTLIWVDKYGLSKNQQIKSLTRLNKNIRNIYVVSVISIINKKYTIPVLFL